MPSKLKKIFEVLAPAGNFEHLQAAIDSGADAVYIGLQGFSARPNAWSFTLEEIPAAVRFAHESNCRVHIAVNAEFHTNQSDDLAKAVGIFSDCGVDALIVGDFGLLHYLKKLGNQIPVHASTLLGIYNAQGIRLLNREYGVNRVVLNTNLYIDEIAELHRLCPEIELEMIAHGGICFNDNRRCRQPHYLFEGEFCVGCKQLYESFPDTQKLVQLQPISKIASQVRTPEVAVGGDRLIWSPEIDLSAIVGLFMRVGVISFKIEGRTRATEYIRQSTRKFREAIDATLAEEEFFEDELNKYFYLAHHAQLRSRI